MRKELQGTSKNGENGYFSSVLVFFIQTIELML